MLVSIVQSVPQLVGGKSGRRLPKQKFCLPKLLSMPTQTFLTLAAVSRWWLFFYWRSTESLEKIRPIWRDDLFFFEINKKLGENKTNPKVLATPQKEIFPPLKQRSSCATMCSIMNKNNSYI